MRPSSHAPMLEHWEWQSQGACDEHSHDLFFHPPNERGPERAAREGKAKAICAGCPVMQVCRTHAAVSRQAYGVWGGLSPEERGMGR